MSIYHLHECEAYQGKRLLALTRDKEGASLPYNQRWNHTRILEGGEERLKDLISFGLKDVKAAVSDIAKQGYHAFELKLLVRGG